METSFLDCADGIQHLTIDLNREWEVQFWLRKLNVSEADLRRAVAASNGKAVQVIHLLTAWSGCRVS